MWMGHSAQAVTRPAYSLEASLEDNCSDWI